MPSSSLTNVLDTHQTLSDHGNVEDDEGWTLVTRKKQRKHSKFQPQIVCPKKTQKVVKSQARPTDHSKQNLLTPTSLKNFPENYFERVGVNTISTAVRADTVENTQEVGEASTSTTPPPQGARIQHSEAEMGMEITEESKEKHIKCASCNTTLTFSDEDLLLGSKPHNRPLYVTGYIRGQSVNRILVDGGSGVNLMPKATMKELGIAIDELTDSRMIIHGFNLNGERAIGMIRLNLTMGDLSSDTLFHVIESKSSFKLLLGRPWQHENGVVASTLHQCLKYYRGGERKINGDAKPFTKADSFFADSKFFEEDGVSGELMPSVISSTGKGGKQGMKIKPELETDTQLAEELQDKSHAGSKADIASTQNKVVSEPNTSTPILRYIPKSRRKDGDSPFTECQNSLTKSSKDGKIKGIVTQEWVAKVVLPVTSCSQGQFEKAPPAGFVFSSNETPVQDMKGVFDAKTFKLMEKSGYDFKNPAPLGKMLLPHPYGIDQVKGVIPKHAGLGYNSTAPIRISARRKDNTSSTYQISGEEAEASISSLHKSSVFDRIGASDHETRPSVFERINLPMKRKTLPIKTSVFSRLDTCRSRKRKISHAFSSKKQGVFDRLALPADSIFSRLKQPFQTDERHKEIVSNDDEVVASFHVTAEEVLEEKVDNEIEADQAPKTLEDGGQSTVDDLIELNLGSPEDPRPIYVSAFLTEEEKDAYFKLLTEYKDVFAWSYTEMPGLSPSIAVHRLAIKKGIKPKKQAQRRFRPELVPEIEKEVNKLIDAGFIQEVEYPTWIANIVPVRKKNGQLRVCVDFRDLNDACPKDDFPLPVTELMIDATTGHEALSFMDCTAGYNQIRMAPEDQEATSFRTPKGIFCYKVMPFGLKNAGATYQRAMQKIFDDMMHKTIECYVDDVVVKSKVRADHTRDLRQVFERLRECKLKMNPLKCAFGVTSGKFLGFIVTHRGIEIDQTKIKAIQEMPEPKNLRELRGLQGRLAYIRRFISNLAGRCQPFSHLMKKDAPFIWDEKCRNAFESIKKYLSSAPVLGAPVPGKPLILYITAQEQSLGAMCAQENDERKEIALYYLSRTLVGAEVKYSPIEKICLALVFAVQKLRHYMQAHTVHVVSKADPIKYILSRPVLSGRLAKWAVLLKQYDLVFVPKKATKGQAIADFFADHPIPAEWELSVDLPGEEVFLVDILPLWQMYFDGAARRDGVGAGIVFVSPNNMCCHILLR